MAGRVIVIGSVNVDLVATVARLPAPGETVADGTFARHPGGKGGNQATAAARLGASVAFVGAVGDDPFGGVARISLGDEGVDITDLTTANAPTGVALILVDARGENLIAVASGANATMTPAAVVEALDRLGPGRGDVVVACNEIPLDASLAGLETAHALGALTVLNPAPATGVRRAHLAVTDVLVPNRVELRSVVAGDAGPDPGPGDEERDVVAIARALLDGTGDGPAVRDAVVVTLGEHGAVVVRRDVDPIWIEAPPVAAVDATGAGDTFVGALAAGLAEGRDVEAAARRAVIAASLSTTRPGARGGMPTSAELELAIPRS